MPEYMFLGDIPEATRLRAEETFAKHRVCARTFDDINWLYVRSEEPDLARSASRMLRELLVGPWLDVDAAVRALMRQFLWNPAWGEYPRTLLLEDSLDYQIAPMLPRLRNLNVLVLSGLDFNNIGRNYTGDFWHPLDSCTFQLSNLEIERVDKLRIHNIHFHATGPFVPLFGVRSSVKQSLRVKQLYVTAYPDHEKTVTLLRALLNLPLSHLSTSEFFVEALSIRPNIISSLNDFLSAQDSSIKRLIFQVPRDVTAYDPGNLLLAMPLRLHKLNTFLFECPIKDGVWNESLLRLYLATLNQYDNSGLKTLRISLFYIQSETSDQQTNPIATPIPANPLWQSIESLIAARTDIEAIAISVAWCSMDHDVREARRSDVLEDPSRNPYELRGYYPITMRNAEMRRNLLLTTLGQLFPSIVAKVSPPASHPNLEVKLYCNDTKVPCSIASFKDQLF
ncbi:hypothetical protein BDZ89DRAFT_1145810 [Hymenopellis radicata]|nr:hypothetical protein BDZ89DRAFT_1145810 [Hymenopellis radicata]